MPRQSQQRRKLLVIKDFLERESDEQHPVTMAQIIAELARRGIPAERKSIYLDLEALREHGMDIIMVREGQLTGYFLGKRAFELPELRLLVDAVQSSRFITYKKSLELISKLERLTSVHLAQQLHRGVSVWQRIKSMNESIYYNVDEIQTAMAEDQQITFQYFDYNVQRQRVWRRGGALYRVSPYGLHWDNENYYMIAYEPNAGQLRHYRVDRMAQIRLEGSRREGDPSLRELNMAQYTSRVFSMYAGEEASVQLRFDCQLVNAVIDRFGKEVPLTPDGEAHFTTRVTVVVSPQFFGWLCGFGDQVQILHPVEVAAQYKTHLRASLAAQMGD